MDDKTRKRLWYEQHKEELKQRGREYRQRNRARIKAYNRAYRLKNLKKIKERIKKWEAEHPELVVLQRRREHDQRYHGGQREDTIKRFGGLCYLCAKDTTLKYRDGHVHHCAGRKDHKNTVLLCASCHAMVHNSKVELVVLDELKPNKV